MIPILTPAEMAAVDAAAPEPVEVLIERAGAAVARRALAMLGGGYGRRVLVMAGKGNNGEDGRVAARRLARRGVSAVVVAPEDTESALARDGWDLVVDAAYGTGFVDRGRWRPPPVGRVPVLAVDIPSGVDGTTGAAIDGAWRAQRTVTFAALKPGLVLLGGRDLAGEVDVADIGLDVGRARAHLVEVADVAAWLPSPPRDVHKWRAACWVVAGSAGMTGAAILATRGAQRAGAGYVRLSVPGADPGGWTAPVEAVRTSLPGPAWADAVLDRLGGIERFRSLVVGPGLGRDESTLAQVARLVEHAPRPLVLDGDGLRAAGPALLRAAAAPRVLTPHDGEFEQLTGARPGPDRFAAARSLAQASGCTVLLKGPTTIVAGPDGRSLAVTEGPDSLATAGSGDVLSGIIGALLALGVPPFEAAAAGAFVHGRAARCGPRRGLVAGDLPELLPGALVDLVGSAGTRDPAVQARPSEQQAPGRRSS